MPRQNGYSALQIGLHWAVAVLIIGSWFTSDGMGRALRNRIESGATGIEGNTVHVWLGGLAFLLILVRLVVRFIQGAPGPLPGSSHLMGLAAEWGHRLIYALMILTPLLGAIAWYGGLRSVGEIHEVVGNALMLVAVGHALAAILHQAMGNDALSRMARPRD